MYILCIALCVWTCYYILLYLWHVLIDDEHQLLECHCLTCHSHTSDIEQDTWYLRYTNTLTILLLQYSVSVFWITIDHYHHHPASTNHPISKIHPPYAHAPYPPSSPSIYNKSKIDISIVKCFHNKSIYFIWSNSIIWFDGWRHIIYILQFNYMVLTKL